MFTLWFRLINVLSYRFLFYVQIIIKLLVNTTIPEYESYTECELVLIYDIVMSYRM